MNKENLKKVMSDEACVKALFEKATLEEARDYLNTFDVDCTTEDVQGILVAVDKIIKENKSETMNLDDMEAVAGGNGVVNVLNKAVNTASTLYTTYIATQVQLAGLAVDSIVSLGEDLYHLFT